MNKSVYYAGLAVILICSLSLCAEFLLSYRVVFQPINNTVAAQTTTTASCPTMVYTTAITVTQGYVYYGAFTQVNDFGQFTSAYDVKQSGMVRAGSIVLYEGNLQIYKPAGNNAGLESGVFTVFNGQALWFYDNGATIYHPC